MFVGAHVTDVDGYHGCQDAYATGVQDGIQVCMDNMGVYQESFPWEIHENPHHERLVFGIEDTNFPPLSPSIDGASSLEEYWLSGVNFELGGTDPNVLCLRQVVKILLPAKITHEAVNSRASCLKENLEHWKPNTVDGIQNGIQEVEGRVNLTQLPSESDKEIDKFLRKISLLRRK
ncbi:hypothetical protein KEM48_011290 [Puccinia striiformis f. sp. tritici PST-130]|nr:hypothetical protein KEM48_011290 [Puccinia striiformis f. sp. tritici PST-130]